MIGDHVIQNPYANRVSIAFHRNPKKDGPVSVWFFRDDRHLNGFTAIGRINGGFERRRGRPRQDGRYVGAYLACIVAEDCYGKKMLAREQVAKWLGYSCERSVRDAARTGQKYVEQEGPGYLLPLVGQNGSPNMCAAFNGDMPTMAPGLTTQFEARGWVWIQGNYEAHYGVYDVRMSW